MWKVLTATVLQSSATLQSMTAQVSQRLRNDRRQGVPGPTLGPHALKSTATERQQSAKTPHSIGPA